MSGLKKMIETYLKAPSTDYAIMINGKWGCGKSYYVDHGLTEIIKAIPIEKNTVVTGNSVMNYKPAHISLYGITNAEEFHTRVFYGLNPQLDKKWVVLTTSIISRVAAFFGADTKITDHSNLEFSLQKHVLIFDDLERISPNLSVIDVMGWINAYAEHEKCKVIIVCNEKAIKEQADIRKDNRHEEYLTYKEKTVRFTYNYAAEVGDVYNSVVDKKAKKEREFYIENKSLILDLFKRGGEKNLRTLLFVLDCLYNVCQYAVSGETEIRERILITFMIYAMEYKKGANSKQLIMLVHEELDWRKLQVDTENSAKSIFNQSDEPNAKEQPKVKPLKLAEYVGYTEKMIRMLELVDYIITGDLDTVVLKQTIENLEAEYNRQKETPQGILVKELKNYAYINDNEFLDKISQLKAYVMGNRYNMYELLDVFVVLLRFHNYRIQGFEVTEELLNVFLDALDEASKTHIYDFRFELCVPFWDPQDKSDEGQMYYKLKSHAKYLNEKCYQKEGLDEAQRFVDAIKANDTQKVLDFKGSDKYHGIIYNMNWEDLWKLIISENTNNPVACAAIDVLEYWVVKYGSEPSVWAKLRDYVSDYVKGHTIDTCTNNNIRALYIYPMYSTLRDRMK